MTTTHFYGNANAAGTSPQTLSFGMPLLADTSLVFIAVGFAATGNTVTAVTVTAPSGASGTFALLGSTSGGGRGLELWLGYAFIGWPTAIRVTWTGGAQAVVQLIGIAADSSCQTLPTTTTATNTGTSTSANSGTRTPAVGDVLVAATVWANATGSTVRTSSGNTFVWNRESAGTATSTAISYCTAAAAAASQLTWTITSAAWIGLIANLTLPAPPTPLNAFVYKGRDTAALDAGAVA